jgi:hypothetical protein
VSWRLTEYGLRDDIDHLSARAGVYFDMLGREFARDTQGFEPALGFKS